MRRFTLFWNDLTIPIDCICYICWQRPKQCKLRGNYFLGLPNISLIITFRDEPRSSIASNKILVMAKGRGFDTGITKKNHIPFSFLILATNLRIHFEDLFLPTAMHWQPALKLTDQNFIVLLPGHIDSTVKELPNVSCLPNMANYSYCFMRGTTLQITNILAPMQQIVSIQQP